MTDFHVENNFKIMNYINFLSIDYTPSKSIYITFFIQMIVYNKHKNRIIYITITL